MAIFQTPGHPDLFPTEHLGRDLMGVGALDGFLDSNAIVEGQLASMSYRGERGQDGGFSTRSVVFDHKVSQWRAEHFVPDRNEIAPVYRSRDKRHPGEPIRSRISPYE